MCMCSVPMLLPLGACKFSHFTFRSVSGPHGEELFEQSVSSLALETREVSLCAMRREEQLCWQLSSCSFLVLALV